MKSIKNAPSNVDVAGANLIHLMWKIHIFLGYQRVMKEMKIDHVSCRCEISTFFCISLQIDFHVLHHKGVLSLCRCIQHLEPFEVSPPFITRIDSESFSESISLPSLSVRLLVLWMMIDEIWHTGLFCPKDEIH